MITKCTSWRGHKFEARHSKGVSTLKSTGEGWWADDIVRIIDASKSVTYERDICVRCGQTVEKKP